MATNSRLPGYKIVHRQQVQINGCESQTVPIYLNLARPGEFRCRLDEGNFDQRSTSFQALIAQARQYLQEKHQRHWEPYLRLEVHAAHEAPTTREPKLTALGLTAGVSIALTTSAIELTAHAGDNWWRTEYSPNGVKLKQAAAAVQTRTEDDSELAVAIVPQTCAAGLQQVQQAMQLLSTALLAACGPTDPSQNYADSQVASYLQRCASQSPQAILRDLVAQAVAVPGPQPAKAKRKRAVQR